MNFMNNIYTIILIKSPKTFYVNKTDVTWSHFKKKLKWIGNINEILLIANLHQTGFESTNPDQLNIKMRIK